MSRLPLTAEMTELVDALRAGELTAGATERLEQLLLTSDEAVRLYVKLVHQQAALRLMVGPALRSDSMIGSSIGGGTAPAGLLPREESSGQNLRATLPMLHSDIAGPMPSSQLFQSRSANRIIGGLYRLLAGPQRALPLAALVLLMFGVLGGLTMWRPMRGRQLPVPIPLGSGGIISPFLATLSGTSNCVWQGGVMPTYEGARLPAGMLRLERGLAEIAFDDGARVLLEGPVAFEVTSAYSGFLHQGRLVARVSSPSEGFVVQTPVLQVVDLGTEFGVDVIPTGSTEVYCFEGLIEVQPLRRDRGASGKQRLTTGQAGSVNIAGAAQYTTPESPPLPFVRKLPKSSPAGSGGQVVNVDFNTHESPTYSESGVYVGPGGEAANNLWNGVVLFNDKSKPLQTANGASTTVTVELAGANLHHTEFGRADHSLLDDYAVTVNSTGRFVIRGLWPGEIYSLYLFGTAGISHAEQDKVTNGAAEGTLFTINGQTKATRGLRRGDHPFTAGKDYVVFEGVAASAEGEICGTWSPNPQANSPVNNNPFGVFNGLQIVGPMMQPAGN